MHVGEQLEISGLEQREYFDYSNGRRFSVYDDDNDESGSNCAKDYGGGWWFKTCHVICLNCRDGILGGFSGGKNVVKTSMLLLKTG